MIQLMQRCGNRVELLTSLVDTQREWSELEDG